MKKYVVPLGLLQLFVSGLPYLSSAKTLNPLVQFFGALVIVGAVSYCYYKMARLSLDEGRSEKGSRHRHSAPCNATFLLYLFMDTKPCDAVLGDLEERYKLIRKSFGVQKANFWYWSQALRSVVPIVWAATKRVTKVVGGLTALMELYKKIRS